MSGDRVDGHRGELKIMGQKVRLVIAEDHTILREGLRSLFSSNKDFEIVGEAEDGREAIRCVEKLKPDLILTDLSMPRMNGMDAIREIKRRSSATRILVLTVHKAEEYILSTLKAGADGYILKDSTQSELMMAIKSVLSGKHFISPGISEKVIDGLCRITRTGRVGQVCAFTDNGRSAIRRKRNRISGLQH